MIAFANRLKDLGKRILEAKKVDSGQVSTSFKSSIESNLMDCFRRGLKLEIEGKLEEGDGLKNMLANAIKAERIIEARQALRNPHANNDFRVKEQVKKPTFVVQTIITCQICKKKLPDLRKYRTHRESM